VQEYGHTEKGNRLAQAQFRCLACDYENNADLVGAINIFTARQVVLNAFGVSGR
jgi:putative transposase